MEMRLLCRRTTLNQIDNVCERTTTKQRTDIQVSEVKERLQFEAFEREENYHPELNIKLTKYSLVSFVGRNEYKQNTISLYLFACYFLTCF